MGGYKSGRRKKEKLESSGQGVFSKSSFSRALVTIFQRNSGEKWDRNFWPKKDLSVQNFFALLDRFGEIGKGNGKSLYLHFCISACLSLRHCPYILPLSSVLLFQRKIPLEWQVK